MEQIEILFGVLSNEQVNDITSRLEAVADLDSNNKYHQLLKLFLLEQRRRQLVINNKENEFKINKGI